MALIDIGSTKQLFIDDYLIERMTNTEPKLNPALKVDNNPVLRPERPWEGNAVRMGGALSRGVFFDEEEGLFKMFYECIKPEPRVVDGEFVNIDTQPPIPCLATSEDGINWDRPSLGLVEYDGSTDNNIIPDDRYLHYIFYDSHEDDPARRFKGFKRAGDTQTPGMTIDLFFSPNGFDWTPYENNPVVDTRPRYGRWGPTMFMGWDDIRQVYAVHMENALHRRSAIGKRLIGRSESPDLYEWTDPETILVPDERDPSDTEFYAMPAITYEGWYVGMLWVYNTTSTTHYPEAVFSRDGIHYQRNFRQPFIQRGGRRVEFDYNSIYAGVPIVHGDAIHTYYHGINWRSPEAQMELGDSALGAIGLAVTPIDGFVSLDGAKGDPGRRRHGHAHRKRRVALQGAKRQNVGACLARVVQPDDHAVVQLHRVATVPERGGGAPRRCVLRPLRGASPAPESQPRAARRLRLRRRRFDHDFRSQARRIVERQLGHRQAGRASHKTAALLQELQALLVPVPLNGQEAPRWTTQSDKRSTVTR